MAAANDVLRDPSEPELRRVQEWREIVMELSRW
jgi:hypothetical protein